MTASIAPAAAPSRTPPQSEVTAPASGRGARSERLLIAALITLHVILACVLAYVLNVWTDEAYTLDTTGSGVAYAYRQAIAFEQNAPLYFVVLALWRSIDPSVFFARLFSIVWTAVTLVLSVGISRRYLPGISPAWAVASLALNPFLVWAAVEMRVYAMIVGLSAILLLAYYDGFLAPSKFGRALFFVTAVVSVYTQYYLGFLLAAGLIPLVLLRRWRTLAIYCGLMAGVALAFWPLASILPSQLESFRAGFTAPRTILSSLGLIALIVSNYFVPLRGMPHATRIALSLALLAVLAVAWRGNNLRPTAQQVSLWALFVGPTLLFALAVYLTQEHVAARHPASLLVPALFALFALFSASERPRRLLATWTAATLALSVVALYVAYRPLAKSGDWIRVAKYIEATERAGEPILVFQAEPTPAFRYYYKGINTVVPIPRGPNFRTYDARDFVVRGPSDITHALASVPGSHERIRVVNDGVCTALNVDFGCDVFDKYLQEHYTILTERHFYDADVYLMRKLP